MIDRDRAWPLAVLAFALGAASPATAAVRWQLRGDVASGQQFAAVADAEHVHVVAEHYVRLDAAGTVVLDEGDVADGHQGALDFYPAIAVGPDGAVHVVTRHGGDVDAGYEIRYRRRDAGGGWGPEIIVGTPVARNYVVGVAVTSSGRVLVAHSRLVENVYSVMPVFEIADDTATMIGETPSGWLRADNDFRLATSGSAILLASGEPGPSSPIHVSFAGDGDGDVLGQWEASHVEHEGGIARRGGPATHVDDTGAIHFVYGGETTLHYARYDGSGALVGGDTTVMTDLGMWHLSHGLGAVVSTPDGTRVLVVGLQNSDGDQRAEGADLLYAESIDGGASFGPALAIGAVTDGGEGRMRVRLERVGDAIMLLYYDPATEAIALASATWVDDPPPGGSTDGGVDSTGDAQEDSGDGESTNAIDPSSSSTTGGMTTAELPPGQGRGHDSGCGCTRGADATTPWLASIVLLARRRRAVEPRPRERLTSPRCGTPPSSRS